MQTTQQVSQLLPSVTYGSIHLVSGITLDSEIDKETIEAVAKDMGIEKMTLATKLVAVARKLSVDGIHEIKASIDETFKAEDFTLLKFTK